MKSVRYNVTLCRGGPWHDKFTVTRNLKRKNGYIRKLGSEPRREQNLEDVRIRHVFSCFSFTVVVALTSLSRCHLTRLKFIMMKDNFLIFQYILAFML